jgi:hypothetical protein
MKNIFKFNKEQLDHFDSIYTYSGSIGNCWIYGEGTSRWFSISFCFGDRWCFQRIGDDMGSVIDFYPENEKELHTFIDAKINY